MKEKLKKENSEDLKRPKPEEILDAPEIDEGMQAHMKELQERVDRERIEENRNPGKIEKLEEDIKRKFE